MEVVCARLQAIMRFMARLVWFRALGHACVPCGSVALRWSDWSGACANSEQTAWGEWTGLAGTVLL